MDERDCPLRSDLFTLRIWREATGKGRFEWRGKVEHVLTGEARYFRGWQMLPGQLESILARIETGAQISPVPEEAPASEQL